MGLVRESQVNLRGRNVRRSPGIVKRQLTIVSRQFRIDSEPFSIVSGDYESSVVLFESRKSSEGLAALVKNRPRDFFDRPRLAKNRSPLFFDLEKSGEGFVADVFESSARTFSIQRERR